LFSHLFILSGKPGTAVSGPGFFMVDVMTSPRIPAVSHPFFLKNPLLQFKLKVLELEKHFSGNTNKGQG